MYKFENTLKSELTYKANSIKSSDELPISILNGIEKRKKLESSRIRFKKFAGIITCSAFIFLAVTFITSGNARTIAMDIIKTVFVLDNNNQVVEKPAYKVYFAPSCDYNTEMSDEDISNKLEININFPKNICTDFTLTGKSYGVGITKNIDYTVYDEVIEKIEAAIYNEDTFKSLRKYQPYRSAGGHYEDNSGIKVGIYVANKEIPLPDSNFGKITITQTTKVNGLNAQWIEVKGLDNSNDLTQKTDKIFVGNGLLWSTDHATYVVSPMEGCKSFTLDTALKLAEAFMSLQK